MKAMLAVALAVVAAAGKLPGPLWVVKAQIHAGGRGKGRFKELGESAKGGVRLAHPLVGLRGEPAHGGTRHLVEIAAVALAHDCGAAERAGELRPPTLAGQQVAADQRGPQSQP